VAISYLRKKPKRELLDFLWYFLYRISSFLVLLIWILWFFAYFENKIEPALMPEFTISNWNKTIVFQWMAHIGSEKFYNQIKQNIKENKNDGFVLYYEWVKLWTVENSEKFDGLLWVKFDKKTYVNLSKLYWLRAQDNRDFFKIVNDKDYNVDVTMDDIIAWYEKKYGKISKDAMKQNWEANVAPLDVWVVLDEAIKKLTPRELDLLIYVNRSIMNFIIKSDNVRDTILANSWQKDLFDIILDDRNKVLADRLANSADKKIYVLYGLMHFKWIWADLQTRDPNWKLQSIRYFTPID
jgi:hypothetical protein